jgi:hypothetical protein
MLIRRVLIYSSLTLIIIVGVFCAVNSRRPADVSINKPDVSVSDGGILVRPDSRLLNHLQIMNVKSGVSERSGFRMIGQIVALANPSSIERSSAEDNQAGNGISWVELDPALSKNIGLDLKALDSAKAGEVIGVTALPMAYAKKVSGGQKVKIAHYGLYHETETGTIIAVRLTKSWWGDSVPVIFRLDNAQEWLPGANCEVTFPLISSQSMSIPTTALLHEGLYDYVLKAEAPNRFVPTRVTVEEESPDRVEILTGMSRQDKIVGRGAILLKPYIHQMMAKIVVSGK